MDKCLDIGVKLVGPLEENGVLDAWPKVEQFIANALERDGSKLVPQDFLEQVSEGLMGLYVVQDFANGEILCALGCDVQEYPQSMVFNVAYCGGCELARWANLMGDLEAEAVRLGCDTVRITGRAGWGRVFPDYREMNRIFERKVMVTQ